MAKINTINELNTLRDAEKINLFVRKGEISPESVKYKKHILVCGGTGCQSSRSKKILENLNEELKKAGKEDEVQVILTGCFGFCEKGPVVEVQPDNVFYVKVSPDDAAELVTEHIVNGNKIDRLLYEEPVTKQHIETQHEMPFYKKQNRIALRNCGLINPEDINEYVAVDGYQALAKALLELDANSTLDEVKKSGIRGRGGGGFPSGMKWEFTKNAEGDQKYVLCNADEGDPGAFMDRSILEGDPHSVLEAMAIAGYVIGSNQGYIYVRAEYPTAVHRLTVAIEQAREYGLLGKNILGTGFEFDVEIRLGAGAFVCGEETALMTSIEGHRGEPRPRPPFPAIKGLWAKPTLLNNVETYANIPMIILKGGDWYSSIGTEKSKGTKVFALGGKINNTGLVGVPMGTTLKEIVFDIGGGIPNGKAFKAVQTGGPSGGCIPAENIETPIDYDSLIAAGSMMGSGGMIIMDEDNCMVDIAKFFLEFTVDESCGKCPPCRIGTKRMLEILHRITDGNGTMEDLDKLEMLAKNIKAASLCGLGQSAPNPVLSTIKHFRNEYEDHILNKTCTAGVCTAMTYYKVSKDTCRSCGICAKQCPVNAISGQKGEPYVIDKDKCSKCGLCMTKCPFKAIFKNH